jgi:hypothetical protein
MTRAGSPVDASRPSRPAARRSASRRRGSARRCRQRVGAESGRDHEERRRVRHCSDALMSRRGRRPPFDHSRRHAGKYRTNIASGRSSTLIVGVAASERARHRAEIQVRGRLTHDVVAPRREWHSPRPTGDQGGDGGQEQAQQDQREDESGRRSLVARRRPVRRSPARRATPRAPAFGRGTRSTLSRSVTGTGPGSRPSSQSRRRRSNAASVIGDLPRRRPGRRASGSPPRGSGT